MPPKVIQHFRLNGRPGCRIHLKKQKLLSEDIEEAKKKPTRVEWLGQKQCEGKQERLRTQEGAFDTGHCLLGYYVMFYEHMCGGFCLDMCFHCSSGLLENFTVCSQQVHSKENDPSTKCTRGIKVIPCITLAYKLPMTFLSSYFSEAFEIKFPQLAIKDCLCTCILNPA